MKTEPKTKNYPCAAWRIFEGPGIAALTVTRVEVITCTGKNAVYRYQPCLGLPFMTGHCPVTELASTRHKALKKLNQILTALESRPPLSTCGNGDTAPLGMTDSGASKTQPQSTTA